MIRRSWHRHDITDLFIYSFDLFILLQISLNNSVNHANNTTFTNNIHKLP